MEMMNEYCLIMPDQMNGKQKSGLILLENPENFETGTVVKVGKGEVNDDGSVRPIGCAVGDKVLYNLHAGTYQEYQGKQHLILPDDGILCKII